MNAHDADLVIVGGGLVGTALAAALAHSPLSVLLLEGRPPALDFPADTWDARIYAISRASRRLLTQVGAWDRLDPARLQSVSEMRIFGDDGRAQLGFAAPEAGVDELAVILENRELQRALWLAVQQAPNVRVLCPAQPSALAIDADAARLTLADGSVLSARLVVGADGAQSWVRDQRGIDVARRPYGQSGVVANFECEKPHRGVAHQWFFEDGVLAWLPLAGQRMSMVWSCGDALRDELLALDAEALAERVAAAGGRRLGHLHQLGRAAAFPLQLNHVAHLVQPRLALVGDAAHTVHPLAGQGVNLGFGDVAELARTLLAEPPQRCGDYLVLRRYERARREPVYLMQTVCDGLQKLFNNPNPLLKTARNLGLGLTDRQSWLKHRLVRHAMDA
ncbi:ubiquinone biosynthesis hydroxylase [Chitiniphilus shinanonensis]|uniref:Ubiquinone biosynthesis hydroxylase n=1 Tax=Chitiniphilus shinanonensis TaxID=553088 RepID=A0ABQ6BVQ3_9NEIS|nr:UbiH/UbiF family hydroxylase [Chitiniphilus shinanonensis]GLS05532.1 ubiquinone biosynthesis hydroxylase [Chitiniphilus shinanonensis]